MIKNIPNLEKFSSKDPSSSIESPFGTFPKPSSEEPTHNISLPQPILTMRETTNIDSRIPKKTPTLQMEEKRENIKRAVLNLRIDKSLLDCIKIPEINDPIYRNTDEEKQQAIEARKREINGLIDRVKSLPEFLNFQPGLTLIVGENGQGKSTLAKAIYFAVQARDDVEFNAIFNPDEAEISDEESLKRNLKNHSNMQFIIQSGLARDIAPAIKISAYEQGQREQQPYFDVSDIIGKERAYDANILGDSRYSYLGSLSERIDDLSQMDRRSHRQTIDWALQDLTPNAHHASKGKNRPAILFIDEPESGLGQRRHRVLAEELTKKIPKGSIVIVPTNSVILYDSDLPRIDLEHPERGIFRPSEYLQEKD